MIERLNRASLPRLPLDANIDLTYRCNNHCVHCWLWEPDRLQVAAKELNTDEILRIVDEVRAMGCQSWAISGGEPMLRDDFEDLFDYITRKSVYYKLNTNGTLITPGIAQLMRRRGRKMIAMYGATAEVHDRVTRNPGSFDAFMQGLAYLKEAGAAFEIQIVPMQANNHQFDEMIKLAASLSPQHRIGAPWLWMTACHSAVRNREISSQRLDPRQVVMMDAAWVTDEAIHSQMDEDSSSSACSTSDTKDDRLFASCIDARRDFHIDPYGGLSFCYYIKDPELRFDLRKGSFEQGWEEFIPSLKDKVRGGQEYIENCGSCELRSICRWCGVYGALEKGNYSAKVDYLCQVAAMEAERRETWKKDHLRYYQVAGITLKVETEFAVDETKYIENIRKFEVKEPGKDVVTLRFQSTLPDLNPHKTGKLLYDHSPWAISELPDGWLYQGYSIKDTDQDVFSISIFNRDYSTGSIFRRKDDLSDSTWGTLTSYPSDLILLSQLMSDRDGCCLHASGIKINGVGYLFVGHSGSGKSTMMKMLRDRGEILCDDRIILRRWADGYRIHGNWSHGELSEVSPDDAPIRAIYFLQQSSENKLVPVENKQQYLGKFLAHVIKPLLTTDWWQKTLNLAEKIIAEIPAYDLYFNLDGQAFGLIKSGIGEVDDSSCL